MTRKILCGCIVLVLSLILQGVSAHALVPSPYSSFPIQPSSVFITATQVNGTLDYAEIHNLGTVPANLDGWKLAFVTYEGEDVTGSCEVILNDWLRPGGYGLVGEEEVIEGDDNFLPFDIANCGLVVGDDTYVKQINLIENEVIRDQLVLKNTDDAKSWIRNFTASNSNNLRRTGNFSSDFILASSSTRRPQLYTGGWYTGPASDVNGLQILEVVANSKKCSPINTDLVCGNYIKLFNPTSHDINLADYRLRVGYQGQTAGVANRFTWGQDVMPELEEYILPPGEYFMLTTRNDSEPISITTSGGFVWLEDIYGVVVYEDTILEYPDASSTTKVGWAWAFDGKEWRWTMSPQPYSPNVFLLPPPKAVASGRTLTPCRPDQFRNPETNRCKLIASASSTLTPCKPGQERNPDTNRCRSVAGASTSLTPCKPGQERNPETNRCRKIVASDDPSFPVVEESPTDLSSNIGLWLAGAAGVGAVGYGAYEWRRELAGAFGKVKGILGK